MPLGSDEPAAGDAPPNSPPPDRTAERSPPSASDFWGEGSAAIQDALQGPAPSEPESAATSALSAHSPPAQPPRWPRRVSFRTRPQEPQEDDPPARARRARWVVPAAALCLAALIAIPVIEMSGGRPGQGKERSALASIPLSAQLKLGGLKRGLAGVATDLNRVARSRLRAPAAPTRSHVKRSAPHRAASTSHLTARGSTTSTGVLAATASAPTVAAVSAHSEPSTASSSPATHSAGDSGNGGQPAGPVGPGAPFGPGKLG